MSEDSAESKGATGAGEPAGSVDGWLARLWLHVANKYERYRHLDPQDKVERDWHSLGTILSHWTMFLLAVITAATGVILWQGWYGPVSFGIWDGYYVGFLVHIWAGVLFTIWALFLYSYFSLVVDGKRALVTLDQVKEQIVIALAMVGLASYIPGYKKARRTYDEEHEEWVAHHPMQTAFWYATWGFALLLALTGFALFAELATAPAGYVTVLGFLSGWFAYETILRVHLLSTFLFLASVSVHAYVALLPSNRDLFRSMVNGKLAVWRIDGMSRPEPRGRAETKDTLTTRLSGLASLLGTRPELHNHLDPSATVSEESKPSDDADETPMSDGGESD